MAAAYRLGGGPGLILLKAAVLGSALAIVAAGLAGASPLAASLIMAAGTIGTLPLSGTIRPQVWSVLGLATRAPPAAGRAARQEADRGVGAALRVLGESPRRMDHRRRRAWGLRRHPIGPRTCLRAGVARDVGSQPDRHPRQPLWPGLWRFLATTVRASRPDISEWAPFSLHEPAIMWVSIVVPLVLLACCRPSPGHAAADRNLRRPVPADRCRPARVAGRPVDRDTVARAARAVSRPGGRRRVASPRRHCRCGRGIFGSGAVDRRRGNHSPRAVAALPADQRRLGAGSSRGSPARRTVRPPVDHLQLGRYAIWHFGPALRVSVDGRRETRVLR